MISKECKRLAEVDFPIAEVSRHAVREKSIRHGHPSTLHLWWARRPLASSRAVLMALLLPDPCDAHCPAAFKAEARRILLAHDGRPLGWSQAVAEDEGLRRVLLKFIADFADWDVAANPAYLKTSRALVRSAHGEEAPLVVDPFAGGGSIPLEALRVGCEAFASDLNPVACLILKVMLEDIPRHGPKLADELREAGRRIKERAERELADLYPEDADGATPIAYLWARTVRCEAPNCGAEIPLMRSFWLCKKPKRKRALRASVVRRNGEPPHVAFEVFEPAVDGDVHDGTVTRAKATCLCCGTVLPPERVRLQLSEQRGGADAIFDAAGKRIGGARMTAVVTLRPGEAGRHYRLPTETLVFACVGSALEIYSRHRAVETVDGRQVALAEYLEKVWEVVGRAALRQVLGAADANAEAPLEAALEEDARLTALFLWTLQSTEPPVADEEADEPDEEAVRKVAAKGFSLPFDVVRRFSQPMGIDLDAWTGRVVAQAKGAVRLLPVAERAKALFGEDGAASAADWIESDANPSCQPSLFPEGERAAPKRPRRKSILSEDAELQAQSATALDRLHAAMLLQASGHAGALRALIVAEQERGPAFLRLANALTALYPRGCQEKRLLDAMLLAVPR